MLRNNCSSLNPQTYNTHAKSSPHRGVQGVVGGGGGGGVKKIKFGIFDKV